MYFGIFRYCNICFFNKINGYIENYHTLDKVDNNRVVIAITSKPKNKKLLNSTLKSILDQTSKVDNIQLNIPSSLDYNIPDNYKKFVNIYKIDGNYKDNIGIIPSLLREKDDNTKIILLKDNIIYGKDFIESMVALSNENPNLAIAYNDTILVKPSFFKKDAVESNNNYDKNWLKTFIKVKFIPLKYSENYKNILN